MLERYIYQIRDFTPGNSRGGYGFSILLDRELAIQAFNTKMPGEVNQRLNKFAKAIVKESGLAKTGFLSEREFYRFFNDSWLLQYCSVPGNATNIGIDPSDFDEVENDQGLDVVNWIEYIPHNVDTMQQAYTLLSVWLDWANAMDTILRKK